MKPTARLLFLCALFALFPTWATPLDDYIAKPDPHYAYQVQGTTHGDGYTAFNLFMTSQQWRSANEVDSNLWKHWVTIIMPDTIAHDTALLWITGGKKDADAPKVDAAFADLAVTTKSVVATIRNVPSQPLLFADMPTPRSEDDIIAYTFDQYLRGGDNEWPLLLPMAKAAIRAMDTMASHVANTTDGASKVRKFVVAGGSKRGWTTWLVGAADPRVVAIAPAVIDVLKLDDQMKHHLAAYGFYSAAIAPYEKMNIFARLDTERGLELAKIVDPYSYLDRLTMPKLIINSAGDQFFLPDSSRLYFHELPGANSLRYIPNTDHGLNSDAFKSLAAFYRCVLNERPMPRIDWTISPGNTLVAHSDCPPNRVQLWRAVNPTARDFRLETIGKAWTSTPIEPNAIGDYAANPSNLGKGWEAFFIEFAFDAGNGLEHLLTTDICVAPIHPSKNAQNQTKRPAD